jgi:hypothetical protein
MSVHNHQQAIIRSPFKQAVDAAHVNKDLGLKTGRNAVCNKTTDDQQKHILQVYTSHSATVSLEHLLDVAADDRTQILPIQHPEHGCQFFISGRHRRASRWLRAFALFPSRVAVHNIGVAACVWLTNTCCLLWVAPAVAAAAAMRHHTSRRRRLSTCTITFTLMSFVTSVWCVVVANLRTLALWPLLQRRVRFFCDHNVPFSMISPKPSRENNTLK